MIQSGGPSGNHDCALRSGTRGEPLSLCESEVAPRGSHTLKPCADSLFRNVHVTDFAATRLHLRSLLLRHTGGPCGFHSPGFCCLGTPPFLAVFGGIFLHCVLMAPSWADGVFFGQGLRGELPLYKFSI